MRILPTFVLLVVIGVAAAGCREPASSAAPTIPQPSVVPPRLSPTIEVPPPINDVWRPDQAREGRLG